MLLVFSHCLTPQQEKEAQDRFRVTEYCYMPEDLKKIWSSIPSKGAWQDDWVLPIKGWIQSNASTKDIILVQGEYGATFALVYWLQGQGYKPYYSTSERVVQEICMEDRSVQTNRLFQHVQFREYPNLI